MASIHAYYLADGSKRYRVAYRDPDHQQRTKGNFKRKKDAELWIAQNVTGPLSDGTFIDPNSGKMPVRNLADTWLQGKHGAVKSKYYRDLESAWRVHVEPKWGRRQIGSIRRSEVQTWVSVLSKGDEKNGIPGKSASVVIRAYGVLKGICDMAVSDRLIKITPCNGIQLPKKIVKERTYLTPAQVLTLAHAADSASHRALILTLGFCGLRWGEAAALRVRHIDAEHCRLLIRLSRTRVNKEYVEGPPKTWEQREVPAPKQVMDAISELCVGRGPDDYVFTEWDGSPIREQQRTAEYKWYAKALKASGVPSLTMHDLRHTAASIAISSGANVKAVQKMLGHRSAKMTLDRYADLFDADANDVAARISGVISSIEG